MFSIIIGWVLFMVTQRRSKIAKVSINIKYSGGHDLYPRYNMDQTELAGQISSKY